MLIRIALGIAVTASFQVHCQKILATFSFLKGTTVGSRVNYAASKGVFSDGGSPGSIYGHCTIMYGNYMYSFHGQGTVMNDVWAFDPATKRWAWMAGNSQDRSRNFGIKGIASPTNSPGFRYYMGGAMHRARNEYIMYGGRGGAGINLGALWAYSFETNMWTWLAGSSTTINDPPIYGPLGISTSYADPGARRYSTATVYDPSGEFLVFGGDTEIYYLGDLWAFNFTSGAWTWISGTSSTSDSVAIPQTGVWSATHYPNRRHDSSMVTHPETNMIYLFGGAWNGDMWAFKRPTVEWALLKLSYSSVYGTKGFPSPLNYPLPRFAHSMAYHEASGLILVHGGSASDGGYHSDLWAYNITANQWTWVQGPSEGNVLANYTDGYATPSGQWYGDMAVHQETGEVYIFGGQALYANSLILNHVWSFSLDFPTQIRSSSRLSASHSYELPETLYLRSMQKLTSAKRSSTRIFDRGLSNAGGSQITITVYLILGVAVVLVLLAVAGIFYFSTRRSRTKTSASAAHSSANNINNIATNENSKTFTARSSTYSANNTTMVGEGTGVYLPGDLEVDSVEAFRVEKEIARGGGGSIWLATGFTEQLREFGPQVIVKVPNSQNMNERAVALFHQEVSLLNAFRAHPNIVKLLGYTDNPHSIVLKYYPLGSLASWITSGIRRKSQAHSFIKDVTRAISALHQYGIVHCDLKPDNVLIEGDRRKKLTAVLTDFGIARIVTDKLLQVAGYEVQVVNGASIAYASPETLMEFRGKRHETSNPAEIMGKDTFGIALIIHSVLCGQHPWC